MRLRCSHGRTVGAAGASRTAAEAGAAPRTGPGALCSSRTRRRVPGRRQRCAGGGGRRARACSRVLRVCLPIRSALCSTHPLQHALRRRRQTQTPPAQALGVCRWRERRLDFDDLCKRRIADVPRSRWPGSAPGRWHSGWCLRSWARSLACPFRAKGPAHAHTTVNSKKRPKCRRKGVRTRRRARVRLPAQARV
jgi:hypothetical protein